MKQKLTILFLIISTFLNAQEWIYSHNDTPYSPGPTGNIPIGDQYGMVMKGDTVCYAGGSGGWITTDKGANWTKVLDNTYTINAVAIHPTLNEIYFAKNSLSDTSFILKTVDNGANFTVAHKNKGNRYNEVVITNTGTILAFSSPDMMGTSILYRSDDGGDNWTEQTLSYYSATQVKVSGDTILVSAKGDYAGFYYSLDDGETFNKKNIITSSSRNTHSVCKAPNGDIYIGAYPAYPSSSTNGEIYKSSDFGDNWSVVYTSPSSYCPIYDIEALPNGEIYACMLLNGIIKSSDNGSTWPLAISDGQMELGVGANEKIYGIKSSYLCYLGSASNGIEDNVIKNTLLFSPNPTTGEVYTRNIEEPTKYTLINSIGLVLQEGVMSGSINLQGLPSGLYIVKINNTISRIIKE